MGHVAQDYAEDVAEICGWRKFGSGGGGGYWGGYGGNYYAPQPDYYAAPEPLYYGDAPQYEAAPPEGVSLFFGL